MLYEPVDFYDLSGNLRAILVKKKSTFELYKRKINTEYISKLIKDNHISIQHIKSSYIAHTETLIHVNDVLNKYNFLVKKVFYSQLDQINLANCLVISVGGDGTLLETSHFVKNNFLLGVNSDPQRSVGALCAANKDNFEKFLCKILLGIACSKSLLRIKVILNGKSLPLLALNDILIAHKNPAATSRYYLKFRGIIEEQVSSGVWIATPSGSTGAIIFAGGNFQSFNEKRLQFKVREPYFVNNKKPKLLKDFLYESDSLEIRSKMFNGRIFFDGQRNIFDFPIGSCLKIHCSELPVKLFINKKMENLRNEQVNNN